MRFGFCRFTQLGLLRLLTAEAAMGDEVLSQDDRVTMLEEPPALEGRLRALTRSRHVSPKAWADADLAAFAEASQITPVTLDRAFRGKTRPLVLLGL